MAQLVVEVVSRGVAQTEQNLSKLGQTADKTSRSTDNVSKSNQKLSQTANQVGFQLQDLVVQLQSGTSAFTAIGQQGSQLASVFNPLIGLAVALGSAIAGIAFNAANAAQDLSALEAAGRRIADLKLTNLVEVNDSLRDLSSPERQKRFSDLSEQIQDVATRIENTALVTGRLRKEVQNAQDQLSADNWGFDNQEKEQAELTKARQGLTESLKTEAALRSELNRLRAEQQSLGKEEQDEIRAKENAVKLAERESEAAAKRAQAELDAANKRRSIREIQAQQTLQDVERLGATESQIIGYWYEDNLAKLEGYLAEGLITRQEYALAQEQLLNESVERQLAIDDRLNEQRRAAEQRRTDEVRRQVEEQKRLEEERQRVLLDSAAATSQSLGAITQALRDGGKEQSAAYRVLFAAQQAAAIPSMIVATEEGATKALSLGPIAGPIAAGLIRTLGYASIGTVAGQSIGTLAGRAQGGSVSAGTPYMVGERGREVFVPSTSGSIVPSSGIGGAMVNVTVIDRSTNGGNNVSVRQLTERDVEIIIEDRVPGIMAREQSDPYSRFSKAQRASTTTGRRF